MSFSLFLGVCGLCVGGVILDFGSVMHSSVGGCWSCCVGLVGSEFWSGAVSRRGARVGAKGGDDSVLRGGGRLAMALRCVRMGV